MRFRSLFLGDLRFQWKYGFYLLYGILTMIYALTLAFIPLSWKDKATAMIIFTDPAALGVFFMGAIILLEKSQRVLNSIAVSPVKVSEYILSKVLSIGLISTIVAIILALLAKNQNILLVMLGTFLCSALFTLLGLILASSVESLNQFFLVTLPVEFIVMVPPLLYSLGFGKNFLWFHPGSIVLDLINNHVKNVFLSLFFLLLWVIPFYLLAHRMIYKMIKSVGGMKL